MRRRERLGGRAGHYLWVAALATLVFCGGCDLVGDIFDGGNGGGGTGDFARGPVLFTTTTSTATIRGVAAEGAEISIGTTPDATSDVRDLSGGEYEVDLTGLQPATRYTYRLTIDGTAGESHEFRTPPSSPVSVRFAAYGDSRTGVDEHERVAALVEDWDPDLVVHTGDLAADGSDPTDWRDQWFAPAGDLMASYVIYAAMGNHEEDSDMFHEWLSRGSDSLLNGTAYTFTYGPCFFIVLNTCHDVGVGSDQYDWAETQLDSSAARAATWRIVVLHHPPYWSSDKSGEPPSDVTDAVVPLLKAQDVQLLLAGHEHAYERLVDGPLTTVIAGGGGAPLNDEQMADPPSVSVVWEPAYHACLVDATRTSLTVHAETPDGVVLDEFTLSP